MLGGYPVAALTYRHFARWVRAITDKGLSPKTIANLHGLPSAALTTAVRLGYWPDNPYVGVEPPRSQSMRDEMMVLTRDDFRLAVPGLTPEPPARQPQHHPRPWNRRPTRNHTRAPVTPHRHNHSETNPPPPRPNTADPRKIRASIAEIVASGPSAPRNTSPAGPRASCVYDSERTITHAL